MHSKRRVLADFINVPEFRIERVNNTGTKYACQDSLFLVLTDDEATLAAKTAIVNELSSFDLDTLKPYLIPNTSVETVEALQELEDNRGLLTLLNNVDTFTEAQLALYDRGRFLAEDGEETNEGDYYIYRLN